MESGSLPYQPRLDRGSRTTRTSELEFRQEMVQKTENFFGAAYLTTCRFPIDASAMIETQSCSSQCSCSDAIPQGNFFGSTSV
mmetsp:Transcript_4592/g.29137  ORF Transcript_4592/g.29137 Transcript_4592/m.29137 type:complete len:83 (+) Transcript_4592:17-265(+)